MIDKHAILITGGASFIGANFIYTLHAGCDCPIVNLDKLTYAVNPEDLSALQNELGWSPKESFESGIRNKVQWCLGNCRWAAKVSSGAYKKWIELNYGER
jgi:dTDP-D-glucose 4,6-dehydratase